MEALIRAGVDESSTEVRKAARFLLEHQNNDGGWGWAVGNASEVEPTAVVLDALCEAGSTEYVSVSTAIEVLKCTFEENVAMRAENEALQNDIDFQVQQRIRNIIDTKDRLEKRVSELELQTRRLSRQQSELQSLRGKVEQLSYLRAESSEIRRLLEEALFILSGHGKGSPTRILETLEDLVARNRLHESPYLQEILTDALLEGARLPLESKTDFARFFQKRLAQEMPDELAERIVTLLTALPPSPSRELIDETKGLVLRIETGDVRERSRRFGMRSFDSASDNLEEEVSLLASTDAELADALMRDLIEILPALPPLDGERDNISDFPDYLGRRHLSSISSMQRRTIVEAVREVFRWKEGIPLDTVEARLRQMRHDVLRRYARL
jgi:hypothetical protein